MLKEFALITITVTNLAQVESAWKEQFNYLTRDTGEVSEQLAEYWQAPDMAGSPYIVMQPRNQAKVYIRFVEDEQVASYKPMTSHGWNATELLATDVDQIALNMEGSAFEVIGAPKDLWPAPNAPRVMQAIGPGGELLYITRNFQAAGALGLDESQPLVERAFIMVLGGPSMDDLTTFYGSRLGLQIDDPTPFQITTISEANNLDPETTYPLAIAYTAPGYLLELDELPEAIGPREVVEGRLPPGVAIVGFNSDGISAEVDWVSEPRAIEDFPYRGRRAGILRGPTGELIEILLPKQTAAPPPASAP
jgi:hypothetical protein